MVKHSAQRAMAFGYIARWRGEKIQVALNFLHNLGARQHMRPGGRQFDAQWHAVHQLTNLMNGG